MPTDASVKKYKKTHQKHLFDDGTVTKVGLRKYYIDGSVILPYDIYGGAINEGTKGNIFKYRVTDFYDE